MNLNHCRVCECPTDPGENICEDCEKKLEEERRRRTEKLQIGAEMDRLVRSKHYRQVEMEEILHG